jgi:hypothetical protein
VRGGMVPGAVAEKTVDATKGTKIRGDVEPLKGTEFPSYFNRASGLTAVAMELPRGSDGRVSFLTDVKNKNNYLPRSKHKGICKFTIEHGRDEFYHGRDVSIV